MNRLFRTSALKLSLRYVLLYVLIAGSGLGALYWATSRYVDSQISTGLIHQLRTLEHIENTKGRKALITLLRNRPAFDPENHRFIMLIGPNNKKLTGDLEGWPPNARADKQVRNVWIADYLIPYSMADHDGYWPTIATRLKDGSRLLIAQSVRQAEDLQEFILSALFVTLITIIGLTLVLGWRMGLQMLERIDQINLTASDILQGNLEQRIPVSGLNDEFDDLAKNLNTMLDHIARLVEGIRQVTDNVAHDLRQPLTRLRNRLDVTLLEQRTVAEYIAVQEDMRGDIEGIIQTFNVLLEIAQTESGHFRGEMTTLNISALMLEIGTFYENIFDEHKQRIQLFVDSDLCIKGNRRLIGQAISNILENAYKYAGDGTTIQVYINSTKQYVEMKICDNGPGIPAGQCEQVVKRFVRLDSARSTPGNGLGLSLVAAIAQVHGTQLILSDNQPGLCALMCFEYTLCK